MRLLLDTSTISDFVRGEPGTLRTLKATVPQEIGVSSITLMEIEYGLRNNLEKAVKIRPIIQEILSQVTILRFGKDEGEHAADIRVFLKTQGTPIGAYDVLIAGTARANSLTVVASNIGEFSRVPGISVENWRES